MLIFNILISALCMEGMTDQAIDMLGKMVEKWCKPRETTYATLIKGIAKEGRRGEAIELRTELVDRGVVTENFMNGLVLEGETTGR